MEDGCQDADAGLRVGEEGGEVDLEFEDRAVEEGARLAEVGEGPEEGVGRGCGAGGSAGMGRYVVG